MGIKRDVPIVLGGVTYEDTYEGDFTSRTTIIYTLTFTAKFYLYGPVTSSKVIKTVQADQYTDMPDKTPKRSQRYTVTPNPTTADADDDFGFNETSSLKSFNPEKYTLPLEVSGFLPERITVKSSELSIL